MSTYNKLSYLLTPKERSRGYLLLAMILAMAFLDTVGVASIMPFLFVLGSPETVETNRWLALLFNQLGFTDPRSFLFFLGVIVFIVLVISTTFKALTHWALLRFTHMRSYSISTRFFMGYMGRPYVWFLNRHSSDMGKTILSEVNIVVKGVLIPFLQLIAHGTVALFLVILLILVDPFLAIIVALVLGGTYSLIYISIRQYMLRIGSDRVTANKERYQIAQEALCGIKEVKIFNREKHFLKRFMNPSLRFAKHQANHQLAAVLPRFVLDVLAFGGILLIALYLFRSHGDFSRVLPILGIYAFAGYKLLPALQNIYQEMTRLRFGIPAMDALFKDRMEFDGYDLTIKNSFTEPLAPSNSIILENIYFTYPGADYPVIHGLNLHIPANTTIGFVGSTGSGKTTTVDIILGLLWPEKGQLLIDDMPINSDNVRSWQNSLGYVPQQIYLADDTVASNIAFGIHPKEIDMEAVKNAAKVAELHNFVIKDLTKEYDTLIGERGVRLSGGQRQRIGIARALYHNPKVLVLDEATSSLDNVTEKNVMEAIRRMKGERTIILIAHRLSTVRDCDMIYFLDQGRVKAQGTYEQLLQNCENFRQMALDRSQ